MGAGQIGGIATLLDIDFENAAGFIGKKAEATEGQFVVYFLSHAMLFCMGGIIEAHVVLTTASCIFGEKYKFDVFAGAHKFIEQVGTSRNVEHVCTHKGYNHSTRWSVCSKHNMGLLLLSKQFSFHDREPSSEFIINRIRYGASEEKSLSRIGDKTCKYFGWGSRRNGFLIPLLIHLFVVPVNILPQEECPTMWRGTSDDYLCIEHPPCRDDMGSIIDCSGFALGMMTSRLVDRPCGTGFLDLTKYNKFLTCGVDDSRDVISHSDDYVHSFEFPSAKALSTVEATVSSSDEERKEEANREKKRKEKKEEKREEEADKKEEVNDNAEEPSFLL